MSLNALAPVTEENKNDLIKVTLTREMWDYHARTASHIAAFLEVSTVPVKEEYVQRIRELAVLCAQAVFTPAPAEKTDAL